MLKEITDVAAQQKIDLKKLIAQMREEAGVQSNRRLGDEQRHRLFSSGLLDDLARN